MPEPWTKTDAELEAEADRLLREAGDLRENGILMHRDRHAVQIGDGDLLDHLDIRRDRRSTRQKTTAVRGQVVSTDPNRLDRPTRPR